MRVAYIGPEGRNQILQGWASPGVTVETRNANYNGAIESTYDEFLYVPHMMEAIQKAEQDGFDAALIGCLGDPGLDGVRELVHMPVVGPAEASMHLVSMLADRYGIITATRAMVPMLHRLAERYHLGHCLVGVSEIGCPVLEIRRDPEAQYPTLVAASRQMMERGAEALILGCGSMSFYAERLSADLGIPCLNPLRVGLRMCELLASTGLSHSKVTYPTPSSLGA